MNPIWKTPSNLWSGKSVVILAGGPSLTKEQADTARAFPRIAINNSYMLAHDADMLYAADPEWWQKYPEALRFAGHKLVARNSVRFPGVWYIPPLGPAWGGNSALRAARVAVDAGASRILLLGVDLNPDQLTHWHGNHREGLRNPTPEVFRLARKAWEMFSQCPDLPKIVNCSLQSALTCFPVMPLEEALRCE